MEPSSQPIISGEMIIHDPSAGLNQIDPNSPHVLAKDGTRNGMHIQQADTLVIYSKKLQDGLQELGQKINHHEDNIKYLKTQQNMLEESIVEMKATIDKWHISSHSTTQNQNLAHVPREEETLVRFLEHDKSAASLLCMIKNQDPDHPLTKDVLGIVASLGKVDDDNLSRLLSEYLGSETMLAVVCKTFVGVKALESYNKEGLINKGLGPFASSTGRPLNDPFLVICLETLRPYPGEFIGDDPQRRLDLLKPRSANGEPLPGFLGFAVNMISIDKTHLYCTNKNGIGLRETLFYNLFSRLQVYRSREDMLKAIHYISNGAISLDGGMIKSPGIFRLGPCRELINVKFLVGSKSLNPPENYFELENQIKERRWKKDRMGDDHQREQACLDYAKVNYETKKLEFVQFLAESSAYSSQVGRASTPR